MTIGDGTMPAVRRLLRIVFNTLTVLSLGMAVLVAGLCVRSFYITDRFDWRTSRGPSADGVIITKRWWGQTSQGGVLFDRHVLKNSAAEVPRDGSTYFDDFKWEASGASAYPSPEPLPSRPPQVARRVEYFWFWQFGIFGMDASMPGTAQRHVHLTLFFPMWCVLIPLLVLPLTAGRRRVVARRAAIRAKRTLCPACGYDLRATAERCPECGAVAMSASG